MVAEDVIEQQETIIKDTRQIPELFSPEELDRKLIDENVIFDGRWIQRDAKRMAETGIVGTYVVDINGNDDRGFDRLFIKGRYKSEWMDNHVRVEQGISSLEQGNAQMQFRVHAKGDIFFRFALGLVEDSELAIDDNMGDIEDRRIGMGYVQIIPASERGNNTGKELNILHFTLKADAKIPFR